MSKNNKITVRLSNDQMSDVFLMSKFYTTIWAGDGKIKLMTNGWNFNVYSVYDLDEETQLMLKLMFEV